jgi:hypothetical protein
VDTIEAPCHVAPIVLHWWPLLYAQNSRKYPGERLPVELDENAAPIGVSALIERLDGSQNGPTVLVDQIDSIKVPPGVTHGDFTEVAIPSRNLEPHALNRDRSIAPTLALGFQAKHVANRLAQRAQAEYIRCLGEALDSRAGRAVNPCSIGQACPVRLDKLGDQFRRYRLRTPQAVQSMEQSLRRWG